MINTPFGKNLKDSGKDMRSVPGPIVPAMIIIKLSQVIAKFLENNVQCFMMYTGIVTSVPPVPIVMMDTWKLNASPAKLGLYLMLPYGPPFNKQPGLCCFFRSMRNAFKLGVTTTGGTAKLVTPLTVIWPVPIFLLGLLLNDKVFKKITSIMPLAQLSMAGQDVAALTWELISLSIKAELFVPTSIMLPLLVVPAKTMGPPSLGVAMCTFAFVNPLG